MTRFGVGGFVERVVPCAAMLFAGVSSLQRKRERKKPPLSSQVGRGSGEDKPIRAQAPTFACDVDSVHTCQPLQLQWPRERISTLQTLSVRRKLSSNALMNTIYREGSAKERAQKGA